jgi:group I intron endonuclease
MGVIYKIRNIINNKVYIGLTTQLDPLERWKEHIRTVDRRPELPLYGAMKKYGVDKFQFRILFFCFNEDVEAYEIQMIDKYNSITPNGYNITKGGRGGGFVGKTHAADARMKIGTFTKKRFEDPEERAKMSLITTEKMKHVNMREIIANSEKYKKAVQEGRVGGRAHKNGTGPSEETKEKIRQSILKYYENNKGNTINKVNVEKHRIVMAKSKGMKVAHYDSNNVLLNTYISIADAARNTCIPRSTIQNAVKKGFKTMKGDYWREVP